MPDFDSYLSPFSWRYGSQEMRQIWSEANKRRLWRRIWVALAQTEAEFGIVTSQQAADLQAHASQVDMDRALQIEAENHHDLMAELMTFAEQASLGGPILHLGATSMDIEDNAEALRLRDSLRLIKTRLEELLMAFAVQVERWADTPAIGFTHLQPAEPTTLGYRLSLYAQDLLEIWQALIKLATRIRGKGFKGAVGSAASFVELVGLENFALFEGRLSQLLDLPFFSATSQTYPRRQDYVILSLLADMAIPLYKFAFDLRLLQSPVISELSEPFGQKQVGSSAMPFKRNPIHSEKIDSLARALSQMPVTAWNNAAHSLLERTLDDSANRRSLLAEAFLIGDELLSTSTRLVEGLQVNLPAIQRNLDTYAPFAGTERLLMALVKAGADRQDVHARLRSHALAAWEQVQAGRPNPLVTTVSTDPTLGQYLSENEIYRLLKVDSYLGIAPQQAREIAEWVRASLANGSID